MSTRSTTPEASLYVLYQATHPSIKQASRQPSNFDHLIDVDIAICDCRMRCKIELARRSLVPLATSNVSNRLATRSVVRPRTASTKLRSASRSLPLPTIPSSPWLHATRPCSSTLARLVRRDRPYAPPPIAAYPCVFVQCHRSRPTVPRSSTLARGSPLPPRTRRRSATSRMPPTTASRAAPRTQLAGRRTTPTCSQAPAPARNRRAMLAGSFSLCLSICVCVTVSVFVCRLDRTARIQQRSIKSCL